MVTYYARVPAAAVFSQFDGHKYARVHAGEAFITIGRAGNAIAQLNDLPFCVTAEVQP